MSGSPTSCAANRRTVPAAGKVDGNKNQNFERKPIAVDHVIDDPHQGKVFAQVEYDATNGEFYCRIDAGRSWFFRGMSVSELRRQVDTGGGANTG